MDIKNFVLSDDELNAIDNGVWVNNIAGAEGVELLVTGLYRNTEAQNAIRSKMEVEAKKSKDQKVSDEKQTAIVREVLADLVLKDWKGFEQDGKPLKYSKAMAKKWLTSRNGDALAGLVLAAARQVDENASAFVESVSKN